MTDIDRRIIATLPGVASRSDDPDTRIAAALRLRTGIVMSGANMLPTGISRTNLRVSRPGKYDWVMHAEVRLLLDAARAGASTHGAALYLNWFPCAPCAQAIVHAGVDALFADRAAYESRAGDPWYKFALSMEMLAEASVALEWF